MRERGGTRACELELIARQMDEAPVRIDDHGIAGPPSA
jgi:hypothetical protein